MKLAIKKGFTLIELLVVITIIGILATGAVQVFTSQIQKARDATRISDITALRGGLEQAYQGSGSYPDKPDIGTEVSVFVPRLPTDPKSTEGSNNSVFDYLYNVGSDTNGIQNQIFEISTHLENASNIENQAETDGGQDDFRLEFGISVDTLVTSVNATSTTGILSSVVTGTCISDSRVSTACSDDTPSIVRGN